jgi:hypothetical protein
MKVILMVLGGLALLTLIAFVSIGRPVKWLFSGDDVGWVTVQFNNPACPPLQTQGLFLVVDVTDRKSVCTSSRLSHRLTYFRFEVHENDRIHKLKWGESVWPAGYKEDSGWYIVFVGSRDKFNHSGMPRPWRQ